MIRINDPFHSTSTVFYGRPKRRRHSTVVGLLIRKHNAIDVAKKKQMINVYLNASARETSWNANAEAERRSFWHKPKLLYGTGKGYINASILACCSYY